MFLPALPELMRLGCDDAGGMPYAGDSLVGQLAPVERA